jgi:apolipoprotein N-acyltransferase
MERSEGDTKRILDKYSFLHLAIGGILLLFSNGKWILPLATWFSPVFLIRFSRTQRPLIGFLFIAMVSAITGIIAWQDLIPLQGPPYYVMIIVGSLFGALLYLIDRLVATRITGFLSTLVFPLASVALEYLRVSTAPYGANGSVALTQNSLPFLQLVSITGIWGILFLVTWFAPFVNWMWERRFEYSRIRVGTWVYLGILLAVFLYGAIRLTFYPPNSQTVRVSSVTSSLSNPDIPSKGQDWESFRTGSKEKQDNILGLSQQAAHLGAKIVVWHEGEIFILKEDERAFVSRGSDLAKKENMYLGMAIATFTRDFPKELAENKIVWVDTAGNVLFEYLKAIPTPTEKCIAGDGKVRLLNIPGTKVASTICFDMDFPGYIKRFGQAGVDIMLSPANDWNAISHTHPHQVSYRALEQGFSFVRPNSKSGLSVAYDYQGRLLSSLDYSITKSRIMVADLPTKGVTTVYLLIGDAFAWLCVIGILTMIGWVIFKRKKA